MYTSVVFANLYIYQMQNIAMIIIISCYSKEIEKEYFYYNNLCFYVKSIHEEITYMYLKFLKYTKYSGISVSCHILYCFGVPILTMFLFAELVSRTKHSLRQ